jgi:nitrite reductase/ring-hydroxylating ferredoxin subunit
MGKEYALGPASELPPDKVVGAGRYAVGNSDGDYFAVSRRCRHLGADLANGSIDAEGCLVCPWHESKYDVHTGRMVRGPQGYSPRCRGLARHSKRSPGSGRSVEAT